MRAWAWMALIGFSLIGVPAASASDVVEKIRNEKVLVTVQMVAPRETVTVLGEHPSMVVHLTDGSIAVTTASGEARRVPIKTGDIAFLPEGKETIKNNGSAALRLVRVEFLSKGNDEVWGMSGLAPNYKMLIENRYARAYDIRIPEQSFEPQHTHHARVIVSLAGAELEHILPDGTKQPSNLKTGEIAWRPAATHIGHNLGHTDLWVIAIEPK